MRYVCGCLVLLLAWLQGMLWLSADGHRKTLDVRQAVVEARAENDRLRERNQALFAEVDNLKHRFEATEERARTDLGMIGARETFYQIVP
ncbi:MAG: septum formation initiator family protein [Pseudomonadota bacterium]